MHISPDGKASYPKDAVIPEQTERDREIIPKFVITGHQYLNPKIIKHIKQHLEKIFKERNKKYITHNEF